MKREAWITLSVVLLFCLSAVSLLVSPVHSETSEEEEIARINKMIKEKGYHWTAGKTSVSGLSAEEKKKLRGFIPPPPEVLQRIPQYVSRGTIQLPDVFDWRTQDGTTPAKNQGNCGSCWAFAAVGQLEGHMNIYDGHTEDLSEQQSISCNPYGDGCAGGFMGTSYEIFMDPGAVGESCMPYKASDAPPCIQDQCQVLGRIASFAYVPNVVALIKEAVLDGPVATSMTALSNLYTYTGGCYETETSEPLDHAVVIVGWNDNACGGEGAWIIKNSWGQGWGINGFGYIKYGAARIGSYTYQITYIPGVIFVRLDSPNGGETLNVGEEYLIDWTTQRETPDSINIYLSLDSGENYDSTIVTGLVGVSSYNWTVPDLPVGTAKIKVITYFGGEVAGYDTSDEDFTIKGRPYRYVSSAGGNNFPYSLPEWAAHDIRDAIDVALDSDTIMVAGDTYLAGLTIDKPVYLLGGFNADFTAHDIETYITTVQSTGSIVSFVNATGACGIEGFTITGGTGRQSSFPNSGFYGGGIYCYLSSPVIRNNVITASGLTTVTDFSGGGGICCYGGTPVIEGNEIADCRGQSGGGIYLYQTDATVRNNTVRGSAPNDLYMGITAGGGIYALHSTVVMEGNVITDNDGYDYGGGIYGNLSSLSMSGDTVSLNDCLNSGGGIYTVHSPLSMVHTVITGNSSASWGGGLYHKADSIAVSNSFIIKNESAMLAGGMYADSAWGGIINNTIDRNEALYAGGNVFIGGMVDLAFKNNMITHGQGNGFETGSFDHIAFTHNILYGNVPLDLQGPPPPDTTTTNWYPPLYADTAALDYHLLVHSYGIDGGDPLGAPDPDGSRADIGAYGGPLAVMAAPECVKNLSAVGVNDSTIELTWDPMAPAGLSYFAVYGYMESGTRPSDITLLGTVDPAENTYQHTGIGGCRHYRVSAVSTELYGGGYSNEVGACVAGVDLLAPMVTVVYPNGGELIETGDLIHIRWIATDNIDIDSVSIYFSDNDGADFVLLAGGEPNDSLYTWLAPSMLADSCFVRIVAYDPGLLTGEDTSDSRFSIMDYTDIEDGSGDEEEDDLPTFVNALEQNFPNPFNGTTTITYSVAQRSRIVVSIFDAAGRLVRTLEESNRASGRYDAVWNGRDDNGRAVASGVYFCRIKIEKFSQTRKIVYLR